MHGIFKAALGYNDAMSDREFWFISILTVGGLLLAVLGVYAGLRFLENRYHGGIEKGRRLFATYSVPILLVLLFGSSFYHQKMGYVCNEAGHNTAGWTCDVSWLLIPLLIISISISSWYWAVYRNKIDPLDRASRVR